MEASEFFALVKTSFRYLIEEFGFSVVSEKVFPRFDQAEIVLQSAECRMRIGRDRGAVYLDVSSASSPGYWYGLATLLAYLTEGELRRWDYEIPAVAAYDSKYEIQVRQLAKILRPYCAQICELCGQGALEEKREELQYIKMQVAKESLERHSLAPIKPARTIRHGVWLGVLADLLAAVLFWVSMVILIYLTEPPYGEYWYSFEGIVILGILATFMLLLLPSVAGGVLVASALIKLRGRPHLLRTMILVGAAIAIPVILVAFLVLALVLGPFLEGWVVSVAWLLAFGVPVGGWHGWRMVKWLGKQEQATRETE